MVPVAKIMVENLGKIGTEASDDLLFYVLLSSMNIVRDKQGSSIYILNYSGLPYYKLYSIHSSTFSAISEFNDD